MKLAVSGKGGVGKTTVAALLSAALRSAGQDVIAIDADPDANLLACLGYPDSEAVRPLVELKELIEERTGVKPGTTGGMFRMNPRVDDIPGEYSVEVEGIRVLVAGAVKKGGAGCYCPENALVRALVGHVLLDESVSLLLDMEAGVEHLGRGTVGSVDRLLIVVEPGRRSVETAFRIKGMADELGLTRLCAVGNKVRSGDDEALLRDAVGGIPFAGFIPYDVRVREAEIAGRTVVGASPEIDRAAMRLAQQLQKGD